MHMCTSSSARDVLHTCSSLDVNHVHVAIAHCQYVATIALTVWVWKVSSPRWKCSYHLSQILASASQKKASAVGIVHDDLFFKPLVALMQ